MPATRLKFFEDPVELTDEQIDEHRRAGLLAEQDTGAEQAPDAGGQAPPDTRKGSK